MEDAIGLPNSSFFTEELWVTDDHDGDDHGYCVGSKTENKHRPFQ
jgi:hypothetical protein